jgi:DNA/RNA-binding domain of Phe-tRNA-synthetase-like protein
MVALPLLITGDSSMIITNECQDMDLLAAIVTGRGVLLKPSPPDLETMLRALVEKRSGEEFPPSPLKDSIRGLLKKGGFKPTGRNKPASEYLAQAAREGRFPHINNLVDINNYLSLLSGLPISLLDMDETGDNVVLRKGKKEESFVFNSAGQIIDVEGLISICACEGPPLGNPVKDSMRAKLKDDTSNVLGVIYAPGNSIVREKLREYGDSFASMLRDFGEARETGVWLV